MRLQGAALLASRGRTLPKVFLVKSPKSYLSCWKIASRPGLTRCVLSGEFKYPPWVRKQHSYPLARLLLWLFNSEAPFSAKLNYIPQAVTMHPTMSLCCWLVGKIILFIYNNIKYTKKIMNNRGQLCAASTSDDKTTDYPFNRPMCDNYVISGVCFWLGGGDSVGMRRHHQHHLDRKMKVIRLSELLSVVRLPPNAEACPMVSVLSEKWLVFVCWTEQKRKTLKVFLSSMTRISRQKGLNLREQPRRMTKSFCLFCLQDSMSAFCVETQERTMVFAAAKDDSVDWVEKLCHNTFKVRVSFTLFALYGFIWWIFCS